MPVMPTSAAVKEALDAGDDLNGLELRCDRGSQGPRGALGRSRGLLRELFHIQLALSDARISSLRTGPT
jgi:hypothetical protein